MSGLSGVYNSITRMTGLSGLDVDSMVQSLMQLERAKVDKVSQDRQILLWKQEKYRSITSALQGFNNEFFNTLVPSTDMRSSTTYNAFAVKYNSEATSAYFSVSTGSGTRAGEYTIKNVVTALAAKVASPAELAGITGETLTTENINSISSTLGNNKVAVVLNGVKREITIKDNPTDMSDLINDLQGKLDTAFGSGKITVGSDANRLVFDTSNTNNLSLEKVANNGYSSIFGVDLSGGITLTSDTNRFKISLGTETKEFVLPAGTQYANADELAAAIQGLVDDAVIGFGADKINVKNESGKIVLESVESQLTAMASAADNGGFTALGLLDGEASNKFDLDANLYDIKDSFGAALNLTGEDGDISFEINGESFTFNSKTTSIMTIINTVNSNVAANVRMTYDQVNNRFQLETKETGVTASLNSSDVSGGFLTRFSLTAVDARGRDASLVFNDGVNGDQVFTRSTNSIDVGSIVVNVKKDYTDEITIDISSDTSKAIETIKGFVSKYNDLIDKITKEFSETRDYSYSPLTDDQKYEMTEEQIKQWEDATKTGLLAGDGMLRSIVSEMRNALVQSVEGAGLSLTSIGIKSNSWTDKGKLYIDEAKLTKALSENPDQVISLFTKQADITYATAAADPSKRADRFKKSGLINRLSDIIQDNIRTATINGRRGVLLEKAGAVGDRSQYNNTLFSQIDKYDTRISRLNDELITKENNYYSQFAQLETLISNMNTQSIWLSQQFK